MTDLVILSGQQGPGRWHDESVSRGCEDPSARARERRGAAPVGVASVEKCVRRNFEFVRLFQSGLRFFARDRDHALTASSVANPVLS
jgi:hypothetical protein